MKNINQILKLISDQTKLRILVVLLNRRCCVGHLQNGLNLTQANTSKNLNLLSSAGILKKMKQKNKVYYSIDESFIDEYGEIYTLLVSLSKKPDFLDDIERIKDKRHCKCEEDCQCII